MRDKELTMEVLRQTEEAADDAIKESDEKIKERPLP